MLQLESNLFISHSEMIECDECKCTVQLHCWLSQLIVPATLCYVLV